MATADPNTRTDPYRRYNFKIEIEGILQAGFKECYGLEAIQDVIEYREGADKTLALRKLPGLARNQNVTLMRGITDNMKLWDWREKAITGKIQRTTCTIHLTDDTNENKLSWVLDQAWPVRWDGPRFDATASEVAIETLVITHEGMTMVRGKTDSAAK